MALHWLSWEMPVAHFVWALSCFSWVLWKNKQLVENQFNILELICDVFFSISVGKDEKKKEKKEDSEKTVRDNIRKSLKEILTTRYGIPVYKFCMHYMDIVNSTFLNSNLIENSRTTGLSVVSMTVMCNPRKNKVDWLIYLLCYIKGLKTTVTF